MSLTDTAIRNAKPGPKTRRLFDGRGLYLEVAPNGGKWWRFKYRFEGREKRISLGVYPDISLKVARDRRDDARTHVAEGFDPGEVRKAQRAAKRELNANSFELVARESFARRSGKWAPTHAKKTLRRLERDVFPWIGSRPIAELEAGELLGSVLRRIEARGAIETAHRALQNCGQVFRYAIATGRARRDPTGDLRGALTPIINRHYASITDPRGVGALLRAIDGYQGSPVTRAALRLAPLVFVRPGELRRAEWGEIDIDSAEWHIPGERMKMRAAHLVPLSTQAVAVLKELHVLTGPTGYVFPGIRTRRRPMSENTINAALRRLGYEKSEMTGHGFRSMASTILNGKGWPSDVIERQLAHKDRNSIRAAYNFAEYLPERRKMMQAWADYLDEVASASDKRGAVDFK